MKKILLRYVFICCMITMTMQMYAQTISGAECSELLTQSDSLYMVGVSLFNQGKYNDAIRLGSEARSIYEEVLGKNHPKLAKALNLLAVCCANLGNYTEAIHLGTEALNIREKVLGKDHPDYAISLHNLAHSNWLFGNFGEAIRLETEAMNIRKKALGNKHPDYASTLGNLALYNSSLGNYSEAKRLSTEALNIYENVLGKINSSYATALAALASYNSMLGNYSEAIRLGTESLNIFEKVVGKENPDYAKALASLALYNSFLGNYSEAIRLETEALNIREKVFGKEHPAYATSLTSLALYNSKVGNYTEAIRLGTEALNIFERILGKDHPTYAASLASLALFNSSLDNNNESIRLGTEALNIFERILGKDHPDYAISLTSLALYNSKVGNYNEAIRLETEALNIRKKVLGNKHPDYVSSLSNLAYYNSSLGNYSEAIILGTEVLNIREKLIGPEHPFYASDLALLGTYNSSSGNYGEAIRLDTEALNIFEKALGKEHPNYATALEHLASDNSSVGNYREAIRLGTEALNIYERVLGKEHSTYASSLSNLAFYTIHLGNYSEAIRLETEALNIYEKVYGKEHPAYAASLAHLAYYNWCLRNYSDATRLGIDALNITEKVLGKEHPKYANELVVLAFCHSSEGHYSEATRLGTEALNILEKVLGKEHPKYAMVLAYLSTYYKLANDISEATNCSIEYLSVAKNLISKNIKDLTKEEKPLFWSMYEFDFLQCAPLLAYETPSSLLTDATYSGLLFAKGLLLNAETELRKILLEHGNEEVARIYNELSTNQQMLRKLYEQPIRERKLSTDSLNTVVNNLERKLISISKEYGDYTNNLRIDRKDVQAKLTKDDIAVEFSSFIRPDSTNKQDTVIYCAYLLRKDYDAPKMKVCLKTTKQINTKEVYSNSNLSRAIWGSIADELVGVKNIYFGPSCELYNIAIESLPDWEDSTKLVSDRWNFYRLSSTRELALIKDKNQIKQAVVYGGLAYDTDTASMHRDRIKYPNVIRGFSAYMPEVADSLDLRAGVNELPGTKVEANLIDRNLKAVKIDDIIRTDTIGTETSFKALSGQKKNLLHIATHGFYWTEREARRNNYSFLLLNNDDNRYQEDKALTRSGLLFAGANNALKGKPLPEGVDDGILTAQEISRLDLRGLDLVVLSACETGLGEITGDGVFGLQRGFKKAGAQSILMSLWKVDDTATQMLMTQFYTNLTSGMSKRKSLLEAQRYLREYETEVEVNNLTSWQQHQDQKSTAENNTPTQTKKVHPYSEPKYWAAFILLDAVE